VNLLPLEPGELFLASGDWRARHVRKVLRLGPGDEVRAGVVGGAVGTATITSRSSDGISLSFRPERDPAPLAAVELLLGHPRPIVLRRLLRDLSSIGPGRIVVVPTALGEQSYYRSNVWDDIRSPLVEGAAQGGSTLIPRVVREATLEEGIAAIGSPAGARFVLHGESTDPGSTRIPLLQRLRALGPSAPGATTPGPERSARVCVAVGSERGWVGGELAALRDAGFVAASLGTRILRTETAALVAVWTAAAWCEGGQQEGSA